MSSMDRRSQIEETVDRIAVAVESVVNLLQVINQKLAIGDEGNADPYGWLTVKQAASASGSSYTSILRAIHAGRLKASCLNSNAVRPTYRIRPQDLDDWLETNGGAIAAPQQIPKVRTKARSRYFGEI
jgi:excisionase family DNA binding protein